jgi:hypothetical protein
MAAPLRQVAMIDRIDQLEAAILAGEVPEGLAEYESISWIIEETPPEPEAPKPSRVVEDKLGLPPPPVHVVIPSPFDGPDVYKPPPGSRVFGA